MAPGLTALYVYVGSTDTAILQFHVYAFSAECAIELFVDLEPVGPQH